MSHHDQGLIVRDGRLAAPDVNRVEESFAETNAMIATELDHAIDKQS